MGIPFNDGVVYNDGMYLRRNRRRRGKENFEYWSLVESVRTERGPRQRIVAMLGKVPGINKNERVGWEEVTRMLNGKPKPEANLFESENDIPQWANVNLRGVQVERQREFGSVYLGLILWKRLKLDEIFDKLQKEGREEIHWADMFGILTIARFCSPSSELAIAESWYEKTALEDLLGIQVEKVNENRLYRGLDEIIPHKDEVCKHLQDRYAEWFGSTFDILFYDVTSTYFEGECALNEQAKRGYSRDKRPDCKQVCIGLVVNSEGLPVGYEIFDGNRTDVTTLKEMVELMELKYGKAHRVWVFDRGIVSKKNMAYLKERGIQYIVGTPRNMLKGFEHELDENGWDKMENGVEVKIVKHLGDEQEKFVLCRSKGRAEKEHAMLKRQMDKLEGELQKIKKGINNGRLKDLGKIERRIGRWQGRYAGANRMMAVELVKDGDRLVDLKMERREELLELAKKVHGCYLLATNLSEEDPKKLWHTYMQLNQAEKAFRMSKSDLWMRPVFHQITHRVQAHIFICFLALAMYKSLELWMASKGLGNSPAKLLEEFKAIRSMDVVLPVKNHNPIRLCVVGKPDEHVKILLHRLEIKIPNRPKIVSNVVENLTA